MTEVAKALIQTARAMTTPELNQGTSGNASVRAEQDILITPSGVDYDLLTVQDIVRMTTDGTWHVVNKERQPSSEWRMHLDIYNARPDVHAVVHVHSPFATALACLKRSIPAFHYMVAIAGGSDIRCSGYATFGTQELSELVLDALTDRSACLMAHHGQIACGATLEEALAIAREVESLAGMYHRALQLGEPDILSTKEMAEVLAKFRAGYGRA